MPRQRKGPRRGSDPDTTGDEPTLRGRERSEELSHQPVTRDAGRTHWQQVRLKAMLGLTILLVAVIPLGCTAMIGAAAGWFSEAFALEVLAITLTPSFAAWFVVVQAAFPRGRRNERR